MFTRTEKSAPRSARKLSQALMAAAVSALALTALPVGAQGSSGGTGYGSSANGAMVARDDSKMMADLAHANIAEIEAGKMALEKSKSEEVRKFAQQMIDEHTSALKELQTLAQAKGVKLPEGTDLKHKTTALALKVMTGTTFDNQYMKRAGVKDHEQTFLLLKKMEHSAKDAELKAMATKMLTTVQDHLKMAQQAAPMTDKK